MVRLLSSACFAFLVGAFFSGSIVRADPVAVDLPPQPLASALREFARQTGIQVAIPAELTDGKMSVAVKGKLEPAEALNRLLKGSGLNAYPVNSNTYGIRSNSSPGKVEGSSSKTSSGANLPGADEKRSASTEIHATQVDQTGRSNDSAGLGPSGSSTALSNGASTGLTEIIVTAQKRSERLKDVPVPVSAVSADALISSGQFRIQDYYTSIPALNVVPFGVNGAPNLAIRGITTGAGIGNPTVAVTIDDAPYGSSTSLGGGTIAPDIDPSDLARVEVLRGPQGTLYGSSTIGGLLKYVTVDPSTAGLSGRLQVDSSSIQNGDGPGYGARGAVNIPITDTLALRASAFARRDPGYVDNLGANQKGVNWATADGGRVSALWRPDDTLSLKVAALLQHTIVHGSSEIDPTLGDLKQSFIPDTGKTDRESQVYTANLNAKLGAMDLTAISAYSIDKRSDSFDITPLLGDFATFPTFGVRGTPEVESNKTNKFSQEIRLNGRVSPWFDWLVGGFYTHESTPYDQKDLAANETTGGVVGQGADFSWAVTYAEIAGFTDLTFHLSDTWDLQIGGRESQNRQTYTETDSGRFIPVFFGVDSPIFYPKVHTKDNSFTYLVTPTWKVSPDLMLYARLASGYRPGGPNPTASAFGLPLSFAPDKTKNYELGIKGSTLDHRFSFDASVYYVKWTDIQIAYALPPSYFSYFANGGGAKSEGVELSLESKPFGGLTVSGWVAWNEAVLTEALPATSFAVAGEGDRLPYSSRFSGNLAAEQDFPIASNTSGFVGGSFSYYSNHQGEFGNIFSPGRQTYPAYGRGDLKAGGKYQHWTANLYANNITDKRAPLSGGLGNYNTAVFRYIQPRTVGVSVGWEF